MVMGSGLLATIGIFALVVIGVAAIAVGAMVIINYILNKCFGVGLREAYDITHSRNPTRRSTRGYSGGKSLGESLGDMKDNLTSMEMPKDWNSFMNMMQGFNRVK